MAELDDDLVLRRRRPREHGQGDRGYSKHSQHVPLRDVIPVTRLLASASDSRRLFFERSLLPLVCRKGFSAGKEFAPKQKRQAFVPLRTKPS
jgi:hypothetical protein